MMTPIRDLPENVLGVHASGTVTADDYTAVLIPSVEATLKQQDHIRLLYELGNDFSGFSPGAMWMDTRMGLAHWSAWEKVAVVSDIGWIRNTMKMMRPLLPGEIKLFHNDELPAAKQWLTH
ncbi:MAG: STAS/SEC14 domain-containing protein [Burkholderiaceae bacterium]|nr:MAG: STAS/SEC14 domain-containing protein [Burkholderiaceae bacterium]